MRGFEHIRFARLECKCLKGHLLNSRDCAVCVRGLTNVGKLRVAPEQTGASKQLQGMGD